MTANTILFENDILNQNINRQIETFKSISLKPNSCGLVILSNDQKNVFGQFCHSKEEIRVAKLGSKYRQDNAELAGRIVGIVKNSKLAIVNLSKFTV